jgi:hypothetical protein
LPGFLRLDNGGDVIFRQGEYQINGVGLGQYHNTGGIAAGDLVADIHLFKADTTVDRGDNAAPVELELRAGDRRFIGFDGALCFTD